MRLLSVRYACGCSKSFHFLFISTTKKLTSFTFYLSIESSVFHLPSPSSLLLSFHRTSSSSFSSRSTFTLSDWTNVVNLQDHSLRTRWPSSTLTSSLTAAAKRFPFSCRSPSFYVDAFVDVAQHGVFVSQLRDDLNRVQPSIFG